MPPSPSAVGVVDKARGAVFMVAMVVMVGASEYERERGLHELVLRTCILRWLLVACCSCVR